LLTPDNQTAAPVRPVATADPAKSEKPEEKKPEENKKDSKKKKGGLRGLFR
jgi:ribosomal protein L12E/L44/L45/RPP1/RPP2